MSLGLLLTVIFFVAKVAAWGGFAAWSWWLVFLPLIIEVVVDLLLLIFWGSILRSIFNR
jgi:hypothetical protein